MENFGDILSLPRGIFSGGIWSTCEIHLVYIGFGCNKMMSSMQISGLSLHLRVLKRFCTAKWLFIEVAIIFKVIDSFENIHSILWRYLLWLDFYGLFRTQVKFKRGAPEVFIAKRIHLGVRYQLTRDILSHFTFAHDEFYSAEKRDEDGSDRTPLSLTFPRILWGAWELSLWWTRQGRGRGWWDKTREETICYLVFTAYLVCSSA